MSQSGVGRGSEDSKKCHILFEEPLMSKLVLFFYYVGLAPGVNFINILRTAFTLVDPESIKRYWWLNCIFCAFGIYEHKSCMLNIDEIDPRSDISSEGNWTDRWDF